MQSCPSCNSALSIDATDCAVCGYLLHSSGELPKPSVVGLFVAGIGAALWVSITSVMLIWFYPLLLVASLVGGLVIGRYASRGSPKGALLFVLPLVGSALWLLHASSTAEDFGRFMLQFGLVQTALLVVPALVWPRRRP